MSTYGGNVIVVFVGPSGAGKSTVIERLRNRYTGVKQLESYTTRTRRASDVDGEQTFTSDELFDHMCEQGEFLWVLRPYRAQYRYAVRAAAIHAALVSDSIYASTLSGDACDKLYEFAGSLSLEMRVHFFFLTIEDQVELRHRLGRDNTRTHVEERLKAVPMEHQEARLSRVPYHFIDATLSPERVFEEVVGFLGLPMVASY